MLFAIEWLRTQITAMLDSTFRFLEMLTPELISSFLTWSPVLLAMCVLIGFALVIYGYKCQKLVNSLISGAAMGYLGWQAGTSINPAFVSCSAICMILFVVIGLFLLPFLFPLNVGIGVFLTYLMTMRRFFSISVGAGIISGVVFMVIYCLLLLRQPYIRTPLEGGMLIGLITLHYTNYSVAVSVLTVCFACGLVIQHFLQKYPINEKKESREFRPNAPAPPPWEDIVEEMMIEAGRKK